MKKNAFFYFTKIMVLCMMIFVGAQLFSQNRVELMSDSNGIHLSKSSLEGFEVTFSYDCIESELVETESGVFSKVVIPGTVSRGEIGAPSLPASLNLMAVPFGATPVAKVVGYTTKDYNLDDYGIKRIFPQQPSYSKDTKMDDVKFQYNEKAYKTRSFGEAPEVNVEILGTMRGVQIGSLRVDPVSYNPASNTLRVYNDIEIEVVFDKADVEVTKEILVDTYSPYFNVVYKQLLNANSIGEIFDEHPDLYKTPVYMTVVANSMFEEALQPWLEWKTKKGFYIDVKYVESTESASSIKSYIKQQYDEVRPSFVVVVGDKDLVAPSMSYGTETNRVTDLYYGTLDGDYFPEIYYSRMSCESVEELQSLVNKVLQYEKYTMPDPSYLNNALMVAGADPKWAKEVGVPSINYATSFYFNQAHGFDNVYKYINAPYGNCYASMSTGVGFVNYTAHGVEFGYVDPEYNTTDVGDLTNKDKYFWAMGNCCLTADWGYSLGPCLGEALTRAKEKGAWGYVGSVPVSYWLEDYYFVVGATNVFGTMPTKNQTENGVYDVFWMDDVYNTLSSVPFVGNLSVTNARSSSYDYEDGISTQYYWEGYHTIGDGTVMPYRTEPEANTVSHSEFIYMGHDIYSVYADPQSYVAISKDGVLLGAAMVGAAGYVDVPIKPIITDGEVDIVVTHPRRIPYMTKVEATPIDGPYLTVYDIAIEDYPVNQENKMTLTFRNVGVETIVDEVEVTLSSESEHVTFVDDNAVFSSLESEATLELVDEFAFVIDTQMKDEDVIIMNCKIEYGELTWENKFAINVIAPVMEYEGVEWEDIIEAGGSAVVKAKFKNIGHYKATNAKVVASTSNEYITLKNSISEIETIEAGESATFDFEFAVDENCPYTERVLMDFVFSADNDMAAEGSSIILNACGVVFTLKDDYGDGWANNALKLEYSDGTPNDTITIKDGEELVKMFDIPTATTVTVSFIKDKYSSYECSYKIEYEDGELIYNSGKNIKEGVNCEFIVDCRSDVALEEYDNNVFSVYPNPAKDVVNIKSEAQRYEYQLINNLGQVMLNGVSSGENTISVGGVSKGVYYLRLVTDGETLIKKIMIQ